MATLAGLISNEVADEPIPSVTIFPNPADESISIKGLAVKQISMYDLLGQRVITKMFSEGEESRLQVGSLVPGIYLVRIIDAEGRSFTEKMIKN